MKAVFTLPVVPNVTNNSSPSIRLFPVFHDPNLNEWTTFLNGVSKPSSHCQGSNSGGEILNPVFIFCWPTGNPI